ncbi:MAG: hypothetical protein Q4C65_05550 [Eubacteriales bacterium]|nr:hypothetical protein [Eubacteriales bacterium]
MKILWKLAGREEKQHRLMYFFMMLQLSMMFLIVIWCSTILLQQTDRYKGFSGLLGREGKFVNAPAGIKTPEAEVGSGISGEEILLKYLQPMEAISCYHILADFEQDSSELPWNTIVYDDRISEAFRPFLEEGEWYREDNRQEGELRAVISPNDYGIEVGDLIQMKPYDDSAEKANIRVIGLLGTDAQIVRFQATDDMVSYHNFFNTYDFENGMPAMLFVKSDFLEFYGDSGTLWPSGMMFLSYREEASAEEKREMDDFIGQYMNAQIAEDLPDVRDKSARYLWGQVMETLPVLAAVMLFAFITTVSISALGVKYALADYKVFYLTGLSVKGCRKIQLYLNLLILGKSFLAAMLVLAGGRLLRETDHKVWQAEPGGAQLLISLLCGMLWLLLSFLIQRRRIDDIKKWRIEADD